MILLKTIVIRVAVMLCITLHCTGAVAESAAQLQAKSESVLSDLADYAGGADALVRTAAGVLVFPDVVEIGFGVGGQYGEGVLLIDGKPDGFYTTAGAPFGLKREAKSKSEVVVFRTSKALQQFRKRRSWKVGVDANITVLKVNAGEHIDARRLKAPIVGFVLSDNGLQQSLSFDGSKITRIAR